MSQGMSSLFMFVILFAMMYFLMIRPEKKRKQKAQEMRDGLKKGDVITTIGGIIGKIVAVDDEKMVIETSDDRVRMEFAKWAVSNVGVQTSDEIEAPKKKKKEEPEAEAEQETAETPVEESAEEKEDK